MEQKNFILAVILSVGFIFAWSTFVMPRFAPKPVPVAGSPTAPASITSQTAAGSPEIKIETTPAGSISREPVTFDYAGNHLVIDPMGGGIRHWELGSTKDQRFDLVLNPDTRPLPLSTFDNVPFSVTVKGASAVMSATLPGGVRVRKTLTLSDTGHLHRVSLQLMNPGNQPADLKSVEWGWGPGLNTVASEKKENASMIRALSMLRLKAQTIKEGDQPELGKWVGIDNRYFLAAFVPVAPHPATIWATGKKETARLHIKEESLVPARGSLDIQYQLYVGPKGYTALKKYEKGLEESVDFGFFGALGKLILNALYRLHNWTGNYGWAIVFLTVILQILLLPLTIKSVKAGQAMKAMQPKIKKLQDLYKGDPKRLNVEMMNLYKTSGSNPLGGCLPVLMQLPIFWALFTALRNAYELRGEPFIGWIKDLSVHDPYYALPIIMGAGMFLQQRMAGAVSDPTQRQMMYIMPIVFVFMFASFPSGLVLYWLINSVATIIVTAVYAKMHATGTPDKPEIVKI